MPTTVLESTKKQHKLSINKPSVSVNLPPDMQVCRGQGAYQITRPCITSHVGIKYDMKHSAMLSTRRSFRTYAFRHLQVLTEGEGFPHGLITHANGSGAVIHAPDKVAVASNQEEGNPILEEEGKRRRECHSFPCQEEDRQNTTEGNF